MIPYKILQISLAILLVSYHKKRKQLTAYGKLLSFSQAARHPFRRACMFSPEFRALQQPAEKLLQE